MKKKYLIAALILMFLFALSQFDGQGLLNSITKIPISVVILLLAFQIVSQLLVNFQWYKIAAFTGMSLSFDKMFYINCQGSVVDSITPGVKVGGEVTRAVQISRICDCSGEDAAAVVALQKLFSMSTFFFINLFAVGYLIGNVQLFQARFVQLSVYALLILFLALFFFVFLMPNRIKIYLQTRTNPRFPKMLRVKNFFLVLLEHVGALRKNTGSWVVLLLLAFMIWLIYPLKMYFLVIHIHPGANPVFIGAVTFISYMVAMIPIFPGGLGGFEATMSGLLLAIGFIRSDALIVTIVFRFVTFWFVMLLSLVYILLYRKLKINLQN